MQLRSRVFRAAAAQRRLLSTLKDRQRALEEQWAKTEGKRLLKAFEPKNSHEAATRDVVKGASEAGTEASVANAGTTGASYAAKESTGANSGGSGGRGGRRRSPLALAFGFAIVATAPVAALHIRARRDADFAAQMRNEFPRLSAVLGLPPPSFEEAFPSTPAHDEMVAHKGQAPQVISVPPLETDPEMYSGKPDVLAVGSSESNEDSRGSLAGPDVDAGIEELPPTASLESGAATGEPSLVRSADSQESAALPYDSDENAPSETNDIPVDEVHAKVDRGENTFSDTASTDGEAGASHTDTSSDVTASRAEEQSNDAIGSTEDEPPAASHAVLSSDASAEAGEYIGEQHRQASGASEASDAAPADSAPALSPSPAGSGSQENSHPSSLQAIADQHQLLALQLPLHDTAAAAAVAKDRATAAVGELRAALADVLAQSGSSAVEPAAHAVPNAEALDRVEAALASVATQLAREGGAGSATRSRMSQAIDALDLLRRDIAAWQSRAHELIRAAVEEQSAKGNAHVDRIVEALRHSFEQQLEAGLAAAEEAATNRLVGAVETQRIADEEAARALLRRQRATIAEENEIALRERVAAVQAAAAHHAEKRVEVLLRIRDRLNALDTVLSERARSQYNSHAVHRLSLAMLSLGDAVAHAEPFARELAAMRGAGERDELIACALGAVRDEDARSGVPTEEALRKRFATVATSARRASLVPEGTGMWGHALAALTSALKMHNATNEQGEPVGSAAERHIAYAERALSQGRLAEAVEHVGALEGPARESAQDWLNDARRRVAVDLAMLTVRARVITLAASLS